jgi:hypothetical protein
MEATVLVQKQGVGCTAYGGRDLACRSPDRFEL